MAASSDAENSSPPSRENAGEWKLLVAQKLFHAVPVVVWPSKSRKTRRVDAGLLCSLNVSPKEAPTPSGGIAVRMTSELMMKGSGWEATKRGTSLWYPSFIGGLSWRSRAVAHPVVTRLAGASVNGMCPDNSR